MANIFVEWWKNEPKEIVERFIEHCKNKQGALKKYSMQIENEILEDEYVAMSYKDSVNETARKAASKVKDPILKQRYKFFSIFFKNYTFNFHLKLAEVKSVKDSVLRLIEQYAHSQEVLNELYDLFENRQNELTEDSVGQVIDACTLVEKIDVLLSDAVNEYEKTHEAKEKVVGEMTNFVDQYIDRLDNNDLEFHPVISIDY